MVTEEQREAAAHDFQLAHYNGKLTWFEALEGYAEWLALAEELGNPVTATSLAEAVPFNLNLPGRERSHG